MEKKNGFLKMKSKYLMKGKIIPREDALERNISISNLLKDLKYKPRTNVKELINPINFFSWLIYSIKDIF